ncbi:MAG: type II secretion system F family protein [Acidobacteriota bacterium]|jgi:tight adherence protein B|nr:type II secretion system F family protein [Bryobacteraceae bacterium CoA2 C42]MCA2966779.1 type II secretion system F family protein [Acidobacteriaceae bacterium]
MTTFIVLFILVWGTAMVGWWLTSRYIHKNDLGKVRTRLQGAPAKKVSAGPKTPELIAQEDAATGRIALGLLRKFNLQDRLQGMLEQAGLKWSVARLAHACLLCFLVCFGVAKALLPPSAGSLVLIPAMIGSGLPLLVVSRKRAGRVRRFEEQFPESLEFIARSMRAGHGFSIALEMIHREFQEPLAGEFRRTFEEHNFGMPLELALEKFGQRMPLLDVHFFVSAVMLQKRTGGNLAEILDKLAYIIRERFKLRGRIRAVSAHGRMTGMALTSIPAVVAALMFFVNPDYAHFFTVEETGQWMLGGAVLLQVLGYLIIQKIVSIEV